MATDAQKEAGNYKKGHIRVGGLPVSIETAKGKARTGKGPDGKPWKVHMPADYGYIRRTEGADGDHVDVYVGPLRDDPATVWVVNQLNAQTRAFDEHKVLMGFPTWREALRTYHRGFSDGQGHRRNGGMVEMSLQEFREWLRTADLTKPAKGAKVDTQRKAAGGPVTPQGGVDRDTMRAEIERMVREGATEADIDAYMQMRGITDKDLAEGWGEWLVKAPGRMYEGVSKAITGNPDPAFKDIPAFRGEHLPLGPKGQGLPTLAGSVTYDDTAYADIIKAQLGDRYLGSQIDNEGREIISYYGTDGEEHQAYINPSGMDLSDWNRSAAAAVPAVVGGGLAGGALRALGAGAIARMMGVGTAEMVTSIGQDVAAGQMGSEQGVDWLRAALSGAGGTLFEGLSGPVSRVWRTIIARRGVDPKTGKLTEAARRSAKDLGLDPDTMDARLAREFAANLAKASSPEEVAAKARTSEFGIDTTVGQRTKNPAALGVEEEARRSLLGQDAQKVMTTFDDSQKAQIERAAIDQIGGGIAPSASSTDFFGLGQSISKGVKEARKQWDKTEDVLWRNVGELLPTDTGVGFLPGHVQRKVRSANVIPTERNTPQTTQMLDILEKYVKGEEMLPSHDILAGALPAKPRDIPLDTLRRDLLGMYQGAERGSTDAKAAKAVYDAFNDWIDDLSSKAALQGNPDDAVRLRVARGFTKELHEYFDPVLKSGKPSPTAQTLAKVLDGATSPEDVVRALVGRGGPPANAAETFSTLREILGAAGKDTWDDIRLAYWVNMVQDKAGKVMSPQLLRKRIDTEFAQNQSILRELYTDEERALMERFGTALGDAAYKPPNPSGTSYELERMRRRGRDSTLKTVLQTQSKRELFSKHNVIMSRIYSILAKKLPVSIFGSKEGAGRKLAESTIRQDVRARPSSPLIAPTATEALVQYSEGKAEQAPRGAWGYRTPRRATGGAIYMQNQNQIRRHNIAPNLRSTLEQAARAAGVNVIVHSGGQTPDNRPKGASTRHDHGNAADIKLQDPRTGRILNFNNDRDQRVFTQFVRESAKLGVNGVGAANNYMGPNTIHVGFDGAGTPGGPVTVWGKKGGGKPADWIVKAVEGVSGPNQVAALTPDTPTLRPEYPTIPSNSGRAMGFMPWDSPPAPGIDQISLNFPSNQPPMPRLRPNQGPVPPASIPHPPRSPDVGRPSNDLTPLYASADTYQFGHGPQSPWNRDLPKGPPAAMDLVRAAMSGNDAQIGKAGADLQNWIFRGPEGGSRDDRIRAVEGYFAKVGQETPFGYQIADRLDKNPSLAEKIPNFHGILPTGFRDKITTALRSNYATGPDAGYSLLTRQRTPPKMEIRTAAKPATQTPQTEKISQYRPMVAPRTATPAPRSTATAATQQTSSRSTPAPSISRSDFDARFTGSKPATSTGAMTRDEFDARFTAGSSPGKTSVTPLPGISRHSVQPNTSKPSVQSRTTVDLFGNTDPNKSQDRHPGMGSVTPIGSKAATGSGGSKAAVAVATPAPKTSVAVPMPRLRPATAPATPTAPKAPVVETVRPVEDYMMGNSYKKPAEVPEPVAPALSPKPKPTEKGIAVPTPRPRPRAPTPTTPPNPRLRPATASPSGGVSRVPMPNLRPSTPSIMASVTGSGSSPSGTSYKTGTTSGGNHVLTYTDSKGKTHTSVTDRNTGISSPSKVICTHLMRRGLLPRALWVHDMRHGLRLPWTMRRGYLHWAHPIVAEMEAGNTELERRWTPIANEWARYAAWREGAAQLSPGVPWRGIAVHAVLGGFSLAVGLWLRATGRMVDKVEEVPA